VNGANHDLADLRDELAAAVADLESARTPAAARRVRDAALRMAAKARADGNREGETVALRLAYEANDFAGDGVLS